MALLYTDLWYWRRLGNKQWWFSSTGKCYVNLPYLLIPARGKDTAAYYTDFYALLEKFALFIIPLGWVHYPHDWHNGLMSSRSENLQIVNPLGNCDHNNSTLISLNILYCWEDPAPSSGYLSVCKPLQDQFLEILCSAWTTMLFSLFIDVFDSPQDLHYSS